MRFVDRATFLALPSGTMYLENANPWDLGQPLCFKEETIEGQDQYYYADLGCPSVIDGTDANDDQLAKEALHRGDTVAWDFHVYSRDGQPDFEGPFCIFDKAEIEQIIEMLLSAKEVVS